VEGHRLRGLTSYPTPALKAFLEPCMLLEINVPRERRELVLHIKTALTQEQVKALKGAVQCWLERCTEDAVIQRVARELANKKAWLKKKGSGTKLSSFRHKEGPRFRHNLIQQHLADTSVVI
jgi:hypothetical protein